MAVSNEPLAMPRKSKENVVAVLRHGLENRLRPGDGS